MALNAAQNSDGMSDITTKLDCNACPQSAMISPATSAPERLAPICRASR